MHSRAIQCKQAPCIMLFGANWVMVSYITFNCYLLLVFCQDAHSILIEYMIVQTIPGIEFSCSNWIMRSISINTVSSMIVMELNIILYNIHMPREQLIMNIVLHVM